MDQGPRRLGQVLSARVRPFLMEGRRSRIRDRKTMRTRPTGELALHNQRDA